jgi:dCMP deaminase
MRNPSQWCDVFLEMAEVIAKRSKDDSTQCGAILVSPTNFVLGVGYNGPPPQIEDCKVPWDIRNPGSPNKYDFIFHAEENALLAAYEAHGREAMKGSTMYITTHPCHGCVLRMIRAGVETAVWEKQGEGKTAKCVDDLSRVKSKVIKAALKQQACFVGYEVGNTGGSRVL